MRLHVVDGTFELFRAHYSKRPRRTTPKGDPAKATFGLVGAILSLFESKDEKATHVAVAFDNPIRSFRNDLFDGYKGDDGIDPDLRGQFDLAEEAVRSAGICVWSMDRWEADDALATAAHRWADEVEQVRIMTPDKDLGQCLRGDRVVLVDRIRRTVIDEASFRNKKGVAPRSVPDYLALVGDTADGIPGLPGFGEKSTSKLLHAFAHLESIPDDADAWPAGVRGAKRLAETLATRRQDAMLYRKLATLAKDVPLEEELADLEWKGLPKRSFLAWCEEHGAEELYQRWSSLE